ncbi:hypothetical protein QC761_0108600 [Podospora bellae-mahoneyi]|uniref:Uncharacterized protein n=1 Tax=Podospora bellae-mahoneyi TaxID=2093777 RepID=A0ABR0F8Q9_9PEZI|nr:hypothetical protein QC761_0108600 [Podospora bellae-mahoneyi]
MPAQAGISWPFGSTCSSLEELEEEKPPQLGIQLLFTLLLLGIINQHQHPQNHLITRGTSMTPSSRP